MAPVGAAAERYARLRVESLKQMSVEDLLSQEVVSVSRRPERWADTPSNVFLIRGEASRLTGSTRLPELLRLAPNLFVAQSNSWQWGINARGFMRTNSYSNKLLVLVDGRSVYSPFFSNVFWDATDVFVPDLDRLEVITGPAGVNWGSNAVNGVINILTKPAHLTQGGLLYAGVGTQEEHSFGLRYGGRFGQTGAFRVYAKAEDHDATRNAAGVEDGVDAWQGRQVGFRADWGGETGSEWTLQGDGFRGRYDLVPLADQRVDQANLLLRWSRTLSADSQVRVQAYHDYVTRDLFSLYVATTRSTDVEAQHHWVLNANQELVYGGHYRWIKDEVSETVGFAFLPRELDFGLGGAFVQHDVYTTDRRYALTTGIRFEHNHFSGWETQPNVRLAWRPQSNQMLWAAFGRSTRTPSRLETGFHVGVPGNYSAVSGFDFRAETLEAYELGWRYSPLKQLALTFTAFQHEYDHLRSVEPGPPAMQRNLGNGRSRGLEAFVDWELANWWRLRAGGFLIDQDTWLEPHSRDAERALGEVSYPSHQWQIRNTFWIGRRGTLWFSLRGVDEVPALEGTGVSEVPSYTELSARVGWQLRSDLEVSLIGRHLLEESHPEIGTRAGRREIPRSVQAMVRWEF